MPMVTGVPEPIVKFTVLTIVLARLSVTCTDVENGPVPVGVPVMTQLLDKLRPGGIALPAATA